MRVVGLTGGIATGKSTVARMLAEAGAHVVDADLLAREVVAPGRPAWEAIVARFGRGVLLADGQIDRERLAAIVFHDPDQRRALDRIVHPAVFEAMAQRLAVLETQDPEGVAILDIPLLFETGMDGNLAEVILVYAPEAVQHQRLMQRNGLSAEAAAARIKAQLPIEEKRRRAGVVIDNSGRLEATRAQVARLWRQWHV